MASPSELSSLEYTATLPRKRMGAGMLFTDGAGRVLLVEPTYKDTWEIPGGTVEPDESPRTAAIREVQEELGLSVQPGYLLVVDWVPLRPDRTESVLFIFDGGVLTAEQVAGIRLPDDELRSWAWCTPGEATQRLLDLLNRRVAAAVTALAQGRTLYLENSLPV